MPKWSSSTSASEPSEEEKAAAIEQLKGRFLAEELTVDERALRRFLVTRDWKVDDAAALLQAHLKWRAERLPIKREDVQSTLDERCLAIVGSGASGQPVLLMNFLKLLQVDWAQQSAIDAHINTTIYCCEEMLNSMPADVEQWSAIINCVGIRQPPMKFMHEFTAVMKANYPERCEKIVLYPIPSVIVKMVKSFFYFVPERTRKKVCFVSSLDEVCIETGLERSQLPPEILGASSDTKVEGAISLDVAAGKKKVHSHKLTAGETAEWTFRCVEHTVNFELRFVAEGASEGEQVTALPRSSEGSGEYSPAADGFLELRFDNSFSYLTGKSLLISVVSAKDKGTLS